MLQVIFTDLRKSGRLDLEAVEMATRTAMHRAGTVVLKELLQKSRNEVASEVGCKCGQQARLHEMRPKQILTVLGRIYIQRAYYVCAHCQDGQSPLDSELDVRDDSRVSILSIVPGQFITDLSLTPLLPKSGISRVTRSRIPGER